MTPALTLPVSGDGGTERLCRELHRLSAFALNLCGSRYETSHSMLKFSAMNGRLIFVLRIGYVPPGSARHRTKVCCSVNVVLAGEAISSPLLALLLAPAQFGNFGLYGSAEIIITVVSSPDLELAVPACLADTERANRLVFFRFSLAAATGLIGLPSWLLSSASLNLVTLRFVSSFRYMLPVVLKLRARKLASAIHLPLCAR